MAEKKIPEIKLDKIKVTKKRRFEEKKEETKKENEETELESIVENSTPEIKTSKEEVSPTLKLNESELEIELAGVQIKNEGKKDNVIENAPAYQNLNYSRSSSENYQSSSYSAMDFQSSSSLSIGQEKRKNSFMLNQTSPFDPPTYPKQNERNYESSIDQDKERKRRSM